MLLCNSLDSSEDLTVNSRHFRHWTGVAFNLMQVPELPVERKSLGSGPLDSLFKEKGSQKKALEYLGKNQGDKGSSSKVRSKKLLC